MNKKEALTKLAELELDVKAMNKFKGQAQLLKKIDKSIRYINKFKSKGSNIPALILKERLKEVNELERNKV